MTEEQIKHMCDRFLQWKLPEHFIPDNGISFDRNVTHTSCPPSGTSLFTADQAYAMVQYMIEGMPPNTNVAKFPEPGKGNGAREAVGKIFGQRDEPDFDKGDWFLMQLWGEGFKAVPVE